MQNKFNTPSITLVLVLFIFVLELILYKEISFLHTSNLFFYPAGILLIIGLFSLTLRSGFFDFFYFSFRKASKRIRRKQDEDPDEDDEVSVTDLSDKIGNFHLFFIKSGSTLLVISIISLIGFYLFE
ncbi:DUF3899 domain-containing protein [Marinilactibacillus piezotolerans]|uniref:DUF3899 domain-containing protein n=1 Tax=Marinilactibacillus piezotolerans TaxID=258723 RepID=UPI0009B01717|nr:DUF3899 domain-containing protein [Marinilactibacillus piezotolerans]